MEDKKRMVGSYEITGSFRIGGRELILGIDEDRDEDEKYICMYEEKDGGISTHYTGCVVSDDYLEIVGEFGRRIAADAERLRDEAAEIGADDDNTVIPASSCVPLGNDTDLNGKVVVIKDTMLYPEYRRADRQLYLVTGGFGASPHPHGRAVFAVNLYSCKTSRLDRSVIAGEIRQEHMPKWAKTRAKLLSHALGNVNTFSFGEYSFCPYRRLREAESTVEYILSHSSNSGNISAPYTHNDFYRKASDDMCDLFVCVETGRLYIPAENELFVWNGDIGEPDVEYICGTVEQKRCVGAER